MNEPEKKRNIVACLNGLDDILFSKIVEAPATCGEILQTLAEEEDLQLVWAVPQFTLRNAGSRSVVLDALCKDTRNRYFSLEVQKKDDDDHQKRVRYIGSNIDTFLTEKGISFKDIPTVTVFFLSRFDLFHSGKTVYHVHRYVRETGKEAGNDFHEVYVNAAVRDGSKISKLMQYLLHTDGSHPLFPKLSARVRYLKKTEKGVQDMCELLEAYANERAEKAAKDSERLSAINASREGVSYEIAVRIFPLLSIEELDQIYGRCETV